MKGAMMKKGKGPSLALLLAPEKGEEGGYPESDEDEEDEDSEAYESAAIAAFPELEGEPDRIAALRDFVRLCKG